MATVEDEIDYLLANDLSVAEQGRNLPVVCWLRAPSGGCNLNAVQPRQATLGWLQEGSGGD